ncbi:MAG: endopolygalacturonase [Isosphaera sp.]|nr:endopolygalacturonase [Isosphaera sp.]
MRRPLAALVLAVSAAPAPAEDIRFPADARVVDVTRPPYSAKGDGTADDTRAIQQALEDHPNAGAVVYLPNGTYLVSDTLTWPKGSRGGMEHKNTILQGQSRDGTVIRLKDDCPGFGDPAKRKGVIWTGQKPAQRFRNAVRNLTVDVGRGNPGASGMQFMANNQGGVFDVRLRAPEKSGAVGLDMGYTDEIGPLLVRNLLVEGFDTGVLCAFAVDSMTLEHVTLKGQRTAGLVNRGQVVSVRGLTSENAVPAVVNAKGGGMMVLLDATLTGSGDAAVVNDALLFARNLKTKGYAAALGGAKAVAGPDLTEFCSRDVVAPFGGPKASLNLPVKEAPTVPWDDPKDWATPFQHGYDPKSLERPAKAPLNWQPPDATAAIQAAIDSGKSTVCLPRGQWVLSKPIVVRGKCRRLVGTEGQIALTRDFPAAPVIRIEDGDGDCVVIERLRGGYEQAPDVRFEHATKRALVLRNVTCGNSKVGAYRNAAGAGPLFLDDVVGGGFVFTRQEVYARQLNVENEGVKVRNDGGTLWVLGLKTERAGTLIETVNGGKTELLGCFCYTTAKAAHDAPMFVVKDSAAWLFAGETCFSGFPFATVVRETRGGETKDLGAKDSPRRANGSAAVYATGGGR